MAPFQPLFSLTSLQHLICWPQLPSRCSYLCLWESVISSSSVWLHTVCLGGSFSSSSFKMLVFPTFWLCSLWKIFIQTVWAVTFMQATPTVYLRPGSPSYLPLGSSASCNVKDYLPKLNSLSSPKTLAISRPFLTSPFLFIEYSSSHLVPNMWIYLWWVFFYPWTTY